MQHALEYPSEALGFERSRLPRLLYLSDVPAESSLHGSALLYRLLDGYPPDRLRVVEKYTFQSSAHRRLAGVEYASLRILGNRLLTTRLGSCYVPWAFFSCKRWAQKLPPLLDGFRPDAVLTVAHGLLWLTASEFAGRHGLPLHLIVHDDPCGTGVPQILRRRFDHQFGQVYRTAASRLCVSPFMVEEFQRRYGTTGTVLYPSRSKDGTAFAGPSERLIRPAGAFTVAFAGSASPEYCRLLHRIAEALQPIGGKLLILGPLTSEQAAQVHLSRPNVEIGGLLTSGELIKRLRAEADLLFVPMSFTAEHRANMEIAFPSKLTDYTSVGVPLLICGPEYSSAVRWAKENSGVAEVVETDDAERLCDTIARLAHSPVQRLKLATEATDVGHRQFSHASAIRVFYQALTPRRDSATLEVAACSHATKLTMACGTVREPATEASAPE